MITWRLLRLLDIALEGIGVFFSRTEKLLVGIADCIVALLARLVA